MYVTSSHFVCDYLSIRDLIESLFVIRHHFFFTHSYSGLPPSIVQGELFHTSQQAQFLESQSSSDREVDRFLSQICAILTSYFVQENNYFLNNKKCLEDMHIVFFRFGYNHERFIVECRLQNVKVKFIVHVCCC